VSKNLAIVATALRRIQEVYGLQDDGPIQVELNLEG